MAEITYDDWEVAPEPVSEDYPEGDFVRWVEPGQTVAGWVTSINLEGGMPSRHSKTGEVPFVRLRDQDGREWTITPTQVKLLRKLSDENPNLMDKLKIVFTKEEPLGGGKTLKHFDVRIARARGLSPEQRKEEIKTLPFKERLEVVQARESKAATEKHLVSQGVDPSDPPF